MAQQMLTLFDTMKMMYAQGETLYTSLKERRPEGVEIVIAPKHIGDTVWLCSLIGAYKKQHHHDRIMLVISELQKDIADGFPEIDYTLSLSAGNMKSLDFFIGIQQLWYQNHIRYAFMEYTIVLANGHYINNLMDKYDSLLYNNLDYLKLSSDTRPARMRLPETVFSPELAEMFPNAVLLMPGAITRITESVSSAFWKKVSDELVAAGFTVYSNYNHLSHEFIVEGTEPLESSLRELMILSYYFKGFIGLRSGICDLLAQTDAKLISLHPCFAPESGILPSEKELRTDDLRPLGRTKDLWQYQYHPEMEDELIRNIIAHLTE